MIVSRKAKDTYPIGAPGPYSQFEVESELLIYFCYFVIIILVIICSLLCCLFFMSVSGIHFFDFR